jgi:Family of unknown function (DUF6459)
MPVPPATTLRAPCPARPAAPAAPVLPLLPGLGQLPAELRPLPDATAVRLLRVPASAPPYDDEPRPLLLAAGPAAGPAAAGDRDGRPRDRRPAAPEPGERPDPAPRWPGQFAQALAETLAGARPPRQITPWTTEQARRRIRQLGPMLADGLPRVQRVVTSCPAVDVMEMTVVVRSGPRVRALAVRLERDGPRPASPGRRARPVRWVCTALEAA